jgi:hypothetical protein
LVMRTVVLVLVLTIGLVEVAAGHGKTYSCPTLWREHKDGKSAATDNDFAAFLRTCRVIRHSSGLPESYRLKGYKNRERRGT